MAGENNLFSIDSDHKRPQEDILAQVVSSTFEKMGFMEALPTDEEPSQLNTIAAVMEILSPIKATMFFSAPQQLGWTIAENLYGLEDLTMEAVGDMMNELLNTITGSLLTELLPDQQFTLSIPRLCEEVPAERTKTYVYRFNIDNKGIITIVLNDNNS